MTNNHKKLTNIAAPAPLPKELRDKMYEDGVKGVGLIEFLSKRGAPTEEDLSLIIKINSGAYLTLLAAINQDPVVYANRIKTIILAAYNLGRQTHVGLSEESFPHSKETS